MLESFEPGVIWKNHTAKSCSKILRSGTEWGGTTSLLLDGAEIRKIGDKI
jgi:hypothetical protein